MLKKLLIPILLIASFSIQAQTKKPVPVKKPVPKKATTTAASTKPMKTQNDSLSYAMGVSVGQYLKAMGVANLNYTLLNKAIDQSLKGTTTYFGPDQANHVMENAARAKSMNAAKAEKEKGRQFLLQNEKKAGMTKTASGLQYEILAAGTGPKPTANDTILVHYAGKLINGKEFDSSYKRGQPISIPVSGVIPGWTEAVQLMPTGSKWRLYIPSALGYGDNGAGPDIPGGSTLIFDVELMEITNKKAKL